MVPFPFFNRQGLKRRCAPETWADTEVSPPSIRAHSPHSRAVFPNARFFIPHRAFVLRVRPISAHRLQNHRPKRSKACLGVRISTPIFSIAESG